MSFIQIIDTLVAFGSLILLVAVISKYITKRLNKTRKIIFKKLDKILMRIHQPASKILIILAGIHGILSFSKFNEFEMKVYIFGMLCLISCIVSIRCFYIRKRFKDSKHWLVHHQIFSLLAIITLILHIALSR